MKYLGNSLLIVSIVSVLGLIVISTRKDTISVSAPSFQRAAVFTDVHDLAQGGIQTFNHQLGHRPTHMVFTAYTVGTTGQSQFVYDLSATGEKKGVGIVRLDDNRVMNGAYPFTFDTGTRVTQGIDAIWAGKDLQNREVAVFYELSDTVLSLKWDSAGHPEGTVRFTIELQ